jgi:hypothetical protein
MYIVISFRMNSSSLYMYNELLGMDASFCFAYKNGLIHVHYHHVYISIDNKNGKLSSC